MANTNTYDDKSIEILEGLEPVRKRPGMYIGSTDKRGLHHCLWELIDNGIDEAMAGFGNKLIITLYKDGSASVEDFGRGVPVGKHSKGRYTPEVVYTELHAGGKFNSVSYSNSVGLHGVGAAVCTALSEWIEIVIRRDNVIYKQRIENGGRTINKPVIEECKSTKTGTFVRFKPDARVFQTTEFIYSDIETRIQENAFLLPGVEMILVDERSGKTNTFKSEDGLKEYMAYINQEEKTLSPIIKFLGRYNEIDVEVVMQYTNSYSDKIISFANNVRTIDDGTHVTGFKSAFTKCFNDYGKEAGLIKDKDKINNDDYREGLTCIVSVKIPEKYLQFEGQTKSKLGSPEVRNAVENIISEKLSYYLTENKDFAAEIIAKAKRAFLAREAAKKARDEVRNGKKGKSERLISDKLTPAQSKKKLECELFLVEGDSAGGSAKQGRNRIFQAILPLRGKVINAEKSDLTDLIKNEEISTLIYTIGAGYGPNFELSDSNYGKIIIMTDADTDGAHIQVLLLAFFFKYMRPLVEAGYIYVAMPPLYKVFKGSGKNEKVVYCWDDEQLEKAKKDVGVGYSVQRYKGLGEMNPEQLWETTMNPETRFLVQITIDDLVMAERKMNVLMGKDSNVRREWIEDNVKFTLEDSYRKDGAK